MLRVYVLKKNWKGEPIEAAPGSLDAFAVWESPSLPGVYELAARRFGDPTFYTLATTYSVPGLPHFKGHVENMSLPLSVDFTLTAEWLTTDLGGYEYDSQFTAADVTIVQMPSRRVLEVWDYPGGPCLVEAENLTFGTKDFFWDGKLLHIDTGAVYTGNRTDVVRFLTFDGGAHSLRICGDERWPTNWQVWVDGKPSVAVTVKSKAVFTGPTTLDLTVEDD